MAPPRDSTTLAELATHLGTDGLEVVILPAGSKRPNGRWHMATAEELAGLDGHNVGLLYRDGLAGLDADRPQSWREVQARLAGLGVHTWQVTRPANGSKHDGGGLAVVRTDPPARGKHTPELQAKTAGYSLIPPSTHPAGGQYTYQRGGPPAPIAIVKPDDLAPWLSTATAEENTTRRELEARLAALHLPAGERVPPRAALILAGDRAIVERYATRSEAEQAAITSLLSAGWTFERIAAVFLALPGAGKFKQLWQRNHGTALAWLERSYCAAARFVLANPHPVRARALALREAAARAPWPGRTGGTDRAVYLALCTIAGRSCQATFHASERGVAELAGIHRHTARRALERLNKQGIIKCVKESTPREPAHYTLAGDRSTENVVVPYSHMGDTTTEYGTTTHSQNASQATESGVLMHSPEGSHDVWRWSGLGKSSHAIATAMADGSTWTVKALAQATGKHVVTIRRNLAHLAAAGLAMPAGDGEWVAVKATAEELDTLAEDLDVAGTGERQRARHAAQREAWRELLACTQQRRQA